MSGRRVLVTGSSRGIGREIALRLARDGFAVTLHGRSASDALAAVTGEVAAINGQAQAGKPHALTFDICDRAHVKQVLEEDVAAHGAYYGVVCNAGITRDGAFPALTDQDWDQVIDTGLNGFFNVVQPLVMPMVRMKQGGRIVTLASVSGIMGNRGQVNYSAAKSGLIGATKALAVELASRRITVNCVAPGLIETDMTGQLEHLDEMLKMIPLGRMGNTREVAAAVAFLLSDDAAYMTRQVLSVNGGMV
ncbi:3-ketoacyl-ACP reductase FabG2 [Methylophilus sp.]|uniref:3-ketoacyl-ACP reductase FabG2 n=1 Tax=Methylophilus sp. TaxID=29541 RepID=UPI004035504F